MRASPHHPEARYTVRVCAPTDIEVIDHRTTVRYEKKPFS
jgi:hypothetical protein